MVNVTSTVTDDIIRGLLCSAFEGGSNYWYRNLDADPNNPIPFDEFRRGGSQQLPGEYWHWCELIPLAEGCAVTFEDKDKEDDNGNPVVYRLDRAAIERGIRIMAEKNPKDFADALAEEGDGITGDVFLQCCIFGEVIY